jgi:DNA polymerase I-like protein with 3'-5' exonuclease and polymerase domains
MITILDVENTVTKRDGKKHFDPYEPTNALVQVGVLPLEGECATYTFEHTETDKTDPNGFEEVQAVLDETTVLVGHNISHDLAWIWESGFKYDGKVFDTMLCEYVFMRGQKFDAEGKQLLLSLDAVAERYELDYQKQDTLKDYLSKGYGVDEIPHAELDMYLRYDLLTTRALYVQQQHKLESKEKGLATIVEMTNATCVTLSKIYTRGIKVDMEALESVREQFEEERTQLQDSIGSMVRELMGDTPINLNSPEQMSWVVFSRKPKDKTVWADLFNAFMDDKEFRRLAKSNSDLVYKTRAEKCKACKGSGYVFKKKKDGSNYKNPNKCKECDASGFKYVSTGKVAGLKFTAPSAKWASASGFSTGKTVLETLEGVAHSKGMEEAEEFLRNLRRLSAVEVYLSSFVEGIRAFVKPDGLLHVRLTQHITATGRFSGRDPNMQNMPRGGTFPVKKVFVSRWEGGKIMEADFAQLEFRGAAFLSQDETAIEEVLNGFDVHSYTAKVITEAGQETSRQNAKMHTFAPLYGATGFGRTPAEAAYYKQFTQKYRGIAAWHRRLAQQALSEGKITTPSGREFAFPGTKRRRDGTVTNFTAIKNYPVQSFATADVVPVCLMAIDDALKNMHSMIVNSVHDSVVIDIHPDEVDEVCKIVSDLNDNLNDHVKAWFNVDINVPLLLEAKLGDNWLEQQDV